MKLRRLSTAVLCVQVAWGAFVAVAASTSFARIGGIALIVIGLLAIVANLVEGRRRRRQSSDRGRAAADGEFTADRSPLR